MTPHEMILEIIKIQGKLSRFGIGVHEHYHETLNEVIEVLKQMEKIQSIADEYKEDYENWGLGKSCTSFHKVMEIIGRDEIPKLSER